ncbi:hypothetical protein [Candidatus Nitrosocosmicus sp. SS]|nr:hypothetical protein [Candidatus Nitrosocosmicus sp. SS]
MDNATNEVLGTAPVGGTCWALKYNPLIITSMYLIITPSTPQ